MENEPRRAFRTSMGASQAASVSAWEITMWSTSSSVRRLRFELFLVFISFSETTFRPGGAIIPQAERFRADFHGPLSIWVSADGSEVADRQRMTRAASARRGEPLVLRGLADLRDAATKAAPLSPIDGTRGSGLRARFVLAPGGDASPLKPLANLAWASAGQLDRERWVDAGPELADELTIVTFEEGDPLDAFKGLREASSADGTAGDREDSHLEPLFTLLPDPVTYTTANGDEQRRLILLGFAAGALRRVGGGFRYAGDDGAERAFDPASYAIAAAIASRFVARVRTAGFARVVRELPRLPRNAWGAAARRLVEDLERLAERYREPLTAELGATR